MDTCLLHNVIHRCEMDPEAFASEKRGHCEPRAGAEAVK